MKLYILLPLLLLPFICISQDTAKTPPKYELRIGKQYGGGIIFYIDTSGQHGLIVTKTDLSKKTYYGCPKLEIYANSPGNGTVNTILITKHCGAVAAGSLCKNLELDGYKDWYLPAINELTLLFKSMLPPDLFSSGIYLSSSECQDCRRKFLCWAIDFKQGGKRTLIYKDKNVFVRAMRKF